MATVPPDAAGEAPKLVVVVVIDQMRSDYIDRYQHQWNAGLSRLLTRGAWFRRAAYPYLGTVTCAGHATISTGTFPAQHGMILNGWWDRETAAQIVCTDDAEHPAVSYGEPIAGGISAARLAAPTLADEIRAQLPGPNRVVSLSLKARSAAMLAGQAADVALWFDDRGNWATSTAYSDHPVPFVQRFIDANPVEADVDVTWTRALPTTEYLFADNVPFERPGTGWTPAFPHPLSDDGAPSRAFFVRWQKTPLSDVYLGRLAEMTVDELSLGQGPGTDYLAIGFSALDKAGHKFGPRSHEVQDLLVGLDATLGSLFEKLDRAVGPDRYVVALSADHGVSPIPEAALANGLDAGRLQVSDIGRRVDAALSRVLGQAAYVARGNYTGLYFNPGVYDRIVADPSALRVVTDTILETPGIWQVFRGDQLDSRFSDNGSVASAVRLSYFPGRSGDMIMVPRPYWLMSNDATTHGTLHDYDQRVPVILMGAGINPGQYLQGATPADIAPTLAFLSGVTMATPDGRVLTEALQQDP
jgi:predicted AlkP superfamily pyrophosphatase or phosphodiesterase